MDNKELDRPQDDTEFECMHDRVEINKYGECCADCFLPLAIYE